MPPREITVTRLRVCALEERRPVQLMEATTLTALAVLKLGVAVLREAEALPLEPQVPVRVCAFVRSKAVIVIDSEMVRPEVASGRAFQTVPVRPVPSVRAGHESSRS